MRSLFALIAIAPLTGFASEPAPQPGPTAVSQAAPVATAAPVQEPAVTPHAAAAPAVEPAAATAAAPVAAAANAAADSEFNPPAGYRKKTFGEKTLYCRSDTPVGTRFAKEYCYSQSDLERKEASKRTLQQEVDRNRRTCAGGGCSGGGT